LNKPLSHNADDALSELAESGNRAAAANLCCDIPEPLQVSSASQLAEPGCNAANTSHDGSMPSPCSQTAMETETA